MNFANHLKNDITGNIEKALLCVKKPTVNKPQEQKPKLPKFLENLSKGKIDIPNYTTMKNQANMSGYHMLRVKYNPAKIKIFSSAGNVMLQGPGGQGTNNYLQHTGPAQTIMQVDLVFDAENHSDAFMWDKFSNFSAGKGISDISAIKKNMSNKKYTVQPQIEGLLGLLTQSETRQVIFFWANMMFAGEVRQVDASYTMFNPEGNPIRASVTLRIYRVVNHENDKQNTYWENSFDKLFEKQNKDGGSMMDSVGNILNGK